VAVGEGRCRRSGARGGSVVVVWFVLAAAERPSVLSPPTLRAHAPWLLGPLGGVLGGGPRSVATLQASAEVGIGLLGLVWLVVWMTADAVPLRVVGGVAAAAQLVMVLGPPQALTDVFNYVIYGRMGNPYIKVPANAHQHGVAYALSNWHHFPSPYGPLFTVVSMPLGLLSAPVALWVWKVVVLGCAIGVLVLTAKLAERHGRNPQRAVAAVALCPVTLVYGVGGLHNDGPSIVCLLGAVVLLGRKDGWAAALAVAAAAFKPSFAVVLPFVLLGARDRTAALAAMAAAGAATLVLVTAVFGGALPAVGLQGRLVTPLSLPNLAGVLAGRGGADATARAAGDVVLVAIVAVAAALTWRDPTRAPAAIGVVLLAAVLTISWVMPWYLAWALPFGATLAQHRRVVIPAAALLTAWLALGAAPQLPSVLHAFHYFPTHSVTGLQNHDLETTLVR
jgi:hypothetical protein